ncbi:hypothetical protein [Brevundimonas vesicularis]|uniref:hypothetical protein n=1 Tax=Brevundimonas vesicularis TaxID=41276 RepID=UPI00384F619E
MKAKLLTRPCSTPDLRIAGLRPILLVLTRFAEGLTIMIIALATGSALSAMLLVIFNANQPKPKRVPVRIRDTRQGRR